MPLMTISAPGNYDITSDMTQSNPADHAIYINPGVHYVTITLKARIVGAGGAASTNAGIYAPNSAALNIIGLGGSIRGFAYGVLGDNNFRANLRGVSVVDALFRGIKLTGDDMNVSDCDIRNVTGATWTPNAYCMGIEVSGASTSGGRPKVLRNVVQKVHGMGTGESVGISITDNGLGAIVMGNAVINDYKPGNPLGAGASIGLWIGGQTDARVMHNMVDNFDYGCLFSSPPTGFVDENSYPNCTTPFLDSGGDVVVGGVDG